jgi:hypothetical protein
MANVPDSTLELIYADIVHSLGYKTTVGPVDKSKVARRYAGEATKLPSARLAKAAWRVAAALHPLSAPPPPPPPPPTNVAPRTYNGMPDGTEPNARFCVTGLPTEGAYRRDAFTRYDEEGRDVDGGRSNKQVAGLKPANQMDGRGPCDAYGPFPPWPAQSYER